MLRIMNIPRERSFVDLVFIAFISCGIPAEVVNTAAVSPKTNSQSIVLKVYQI